MSARFLTVLGLAMTVTALAWAAEEPAPQPTVVHTIVLRHGPPLGQTPEQAVEAGALPATVFEQGEPIDVAFTIENRGPGALHGFDAGAGTRLLNYGLQVRDVAGRLVTDPGCGQTAWGPCIAGEWSLAPGQAHTWHLCLNYWVMPLAPGRYTVVGRYSQWDDPRRVLTQSAPVAFEITTVSAAAQRARIEALGRAVITAEGETLNQSLRYLGFIGTVEAMQRVVRGFYRGSEWAAYWAGEAFRCLADREAGRRLALAALQSHGPEVHLAYLLRSYGVPQADTLAATIKGLANPDPQRRIQAAAVLQGYRGAGEVPVDALLGALKDPAPQVRISAAVALTGYREPRINLAVLQVSYDRDPQVRGVMIDVLGTMKATEAIPRLQEVLLTETERNAWAACRGLENIGTLAARDALRKGLALPDWSMRTRCATSLLAIGDESVRPMLIEAIKTAPKEKKNSLWGWLVHAAEMRGSDKAPRDYLTYSEDMTPWIKWLEETPPTGPPLER